MSIHHVALLVGLFVVPMLALAASFRYRKRTRRTRAIFWGAVIGHSIATLVASVASIWPPRAPGPDDELRAALILWTLLLGGVAGAVMALLRHSMSARVVPVAVTIATAGLLGVAGACAVAGEESATLGQVEPLESPAPPGSREPNLTAAGDGRVLMTWTERGADSLYALRIATLNGERWGDPATIARGRSFFVNWADFPSAIVLPDDRIAAHWLERSAGGTYQYDVRITQSDDGGRTWSDGLVPHRDGTLTEHGFTTMYDAGRGLLGAVWLDGRRFAAEPPRREMTLAQTTLAADGTLGPEMIIDERICECCQTSGALTAVGPVIVYRDRSSAEIRDIAIVRLVDGVWTVPRAVSEDGWEVHHCPVNGPAVAAIDRRVAVAWYTEAADTARVLIAFSEDAGGTFGRPIRIDDGAPLGRVDVEMLDDGRAVVSWLERSGDGAEVRLRIVNRRGRVDDHVVVGRTMATRPSGFPRMARQGDRLILAWTVPGSPSRVEVAVVRIE